MTIARPDHYERAYVRWITARDRYDALQEDGQDTGDAWNELADAALLLCDAIYGEEAS